MQIKESTRKKAMNFKAIEPLPQATDKSHHVDSPPTSFRNPWPSFPSTHASVGTLLRTRFFDKKPPFAPIPADRAGLVEVLKPDFAVPSDSTGLKVTWLGHASFVLQCFAPPSSSLGSKGRSLNILLDPVFAERTSPFTWIGPKRYTPAPCSIGELCDSLPVDVVCVSHNHYDHADVDALRAIYEHAVAKKREVKFCVGLGNSRWLSQVGIPLEWIWEGDWWDRIEVSLPAAVDNASGGEVSATATAAAVTQERSAGFATGSVKITCTPSQHVSARGVWDRNKDLWCSWSFELVAGNEAEAMNEPTTDAGPSTTPRRMTKSLFFAGDTGYRTVPESPSDSPVSLEKLPVCPAFAQVGSQLGPFDLALLPIGLNRPRHFMSPVHANAEDSMEIHRDVNAKRSIGMHWGTVRGGLSAYYEDVLDPPREWEDEARKAGKIWRDRRGKRSSETDIRGGTNASSDNWEIGLLDVGESVIV